MRKLVLRWLINAAAIYMAMRLVPGIRAEGIWTVFVWMALILGLVNALIAPIIKVLTCPLIILTLGIFTLVINAVMLLLAAHIGARFGMGFSVDTFGAAFVGAVIIRVVSFALSALMSFHRDDDEN